ncbi:MAG: sulfatase-like hydrolase/transferase [Peptostreptococcaceae bacterium]|nr:sulfatase-like hydrolase/transferase [Peptostreptococcaceae bacterium]
MREFKKLKIFKNEIKRFEASENYFKYLAKLAIFAVVINLFIETFARQSSGIGQGLVYMFTSPIVFVYNSLIILATLSFVFLIHRRNFLLLFISIIWIGLGAVNGVILLKRMTPFTLYDMQNLQDGFSLMGSYMSRNQIILLIAAIAILVLVAVLLFVRGSVWENINYKHAIAVIAVIVGITFGATVLLIRVGVLSTFFGNLNYAYNDYGVPYCFINTSLNKGISKPLGYSEDTIDDIINEYSESGDAQILKYEDADDDYPNIIIVQLESFTNPELFNHIELSNNPIPTFTDLCDNYSSGEFTVPACGAGTANTEFEVLTGISTKFFGPGEYPYKGELRTKTLESMAYVFKSEGYGAHAIHDYRAVFYNRNEVYANLGFDTFTPLEYMNGITKTPNNWPKDTVLTKEIMNIVQDTEEKDFVFTISVEGHGSYPSEQVFEEPYTTVTAEDEYTKWRYEYYVNELHEMDLFVKDLVSALSENEEDTVLLLYGDHIPALDVLEEQYGDGNLYKTQYVIWDNMGLKEEDKDLHSYEIAAEIFDRIGMNKGVIFNYQQNTDHSDVDFLPNLKALGYDMLYGNGYCYGGVNPYEPTDIQFGTKEIKIKEVSKIGNKYYIKGENFTEHSRITLDGEVLDTIYLSPTLIGLEEKVDPKDAKYMTVSQIDTKSLEILTTCED